MDDSDFVFRVFPHWGGSRLLVKMASGKFIGVDFAGHCNQVDVSIKLIFSWRILSMSMIVAPLTWRGGGSNFGEDTVGHRTWAFYNFVINSGDGSAGFL